jgi:ABC-type transport system substrate-binding protein
MVGFASVSCHGVRSNGATTAVPPAMLLGAFEDDYREPHAITATAWRHGAGTTYRIVEWHPDSQFLVARNAPDNASERNRWTRIDWVRLSEMPPYEWAFCLSVYDAATRAVALAAPQANRATPRTGCNGFPFTRMKRAP